MDYYAALDQLATDLTAHGLRATTDPQSVNPDCVLIELEEIGDFTLDDGAEVEARLWVVTRDTAVPYAHKALGPLLAAALDALTALGLPITSDAIIPGVVPPVGGGTPLPALTLTTAISV